MPIFLNKIFGFKEPSHPSLELPEELPESIDEIQKIVEDLSRQIKDFSKENEKLAKQLSSGAVVRKILGFITFISIVINVLFIFRLN